jgi:hypothetical protein
MNPSITDDDMGDAQTPAKLFHLVRRVDGNHVAGHERLREDVTNLEAIVKLLRVDVAAHEDQFNNLPKRTTDVTQLRWSTSMVAALIVFCCATVVGNYATGSGTREQVSIVNTKIDAQVELKRAETRLEEERAARFADAMKRVEARTELLDMKFNAMNEKVTALSQRR